MSNLERELEAPAEDKSYCNQRSFYGILVSKGTLGTHRWQKHLLWLEDPSTFHKYFVNLAVGKSSSRPKDSVLADAIGS